MKRIFILFTFFNFLIGFSQDKQFVLTQTAFTDYVITDISGAKKDKIYKKTLEWISKKFKSDEVIKSKIPNEFIRAIGVDKLYCTIDDYSEDKHVYCYPTKFEIEISFKDGKYKFDPISFKIYVGSGQGWNDLTIMTNTETYYNDSLRIPEHQRVTYYLNQLNTSLKEFILGKDKSNNW
ncbi:DUF4468 domain-containing protein [Elizabethkingia anophelis]|uniref:DUF4468 domain-containing protein n=1 Tax=Elizabethkingia anophelis TaxID=1117645 RepID=UPI000BA87399|nr:DUF4468 domain-containing protein [Elizabethkingia anophelis]ASV77956.1 DUF4468 domain-containing protein [Elizabethkingia anophelis]MCL1648254.1 DUF4468 domain-containing protein [Elizabethkingia anophelis]MCL1683648.1 DUF4468 domain-containing protein [Elizabethkingia anophelis]MDV3460757.1 hypothetical protein [Elizabethkingia anophelis]MDV3571628.1 hypothetical protein [Elizabethkingia anophelis]